MMVHSFNFNRFYICAGLFVLLIVWILIFPYTGDGDSMLHYWNLRHSWWDPKSGLTSWARPVYVLLNIFPARGGVFAARAYAGLLTIIAAWQTIRLADDLEIPNSTLAAPFFIFQPLVFALASDTMTEMQMALGIVIALRLWIAKRFALSCFVVSLLPYIRPEGFFIAPMWGLFFLFLPSTPENPKLWKRILIGSLLATGSILVFVACYFFANDWFYFLHSWSWSASSPVYIHGTLQHHFVRYPAFCGWVLFPLFVMGVVPSLKKKMLLPCAVWGLVITLHTIMFWRGAFGAIGFMRILASTSPIAALVMLHGWNWLMETNFFHNLSPRIKTLAPAIVLIGAAATAMFFYYAEATHHRCFNVIETANYIRQNDLLKQAPRFFAGDPMVLAALGYPDKSEQLVENKFDKKEQMKVLAELPSGAIGVWDNMQAQMWHQVSPKEFEGLGYTTLYVSESHVKAFHFDEWLWGFNYWTAPLRYVVVRKN
jgi:hypothetical protein